MVSVAVTGLRSTKRGFCFFVYSFFLSLHIFSRWRRLKIVFIIVYWVFEVLVFTAKYSVLSFYFLKMVTSNLCDWKINWASCPAVSDIGRHVLLNHLS